MGSNIFLTQTTTLNRMHPDWTTCFLKKQQIPSVDFWLCHDPNTICAEPRLSCRAVTDQKRNSLPLRSLWEETFITQTERVSAFIFSHFKFGLLGLKALRTKVCTELAVVTWQRLHLFKYLLSVSLNINVERTQPSSQVGLFCFVLQVLGGCFRAFAQVWGHPVSLFFPPTATDIIRICFTQWTPLYSAYNLVFYNLVLEQ